jgi:hypothetical protein
MAGYTSCKLLRVTCRGQPSVCRRRTGQVLGREVKIVVRMLGFGGRGVRDPLIPSKG